MKLAPIAIGLLATASLASPAFARGTLHLLHPARSPLNDQSPMIDGGRDSAGAALALAGGGHHLRTPFADFETLNLRPEGGQPLSGDSSLDAALGED